MTPSTLVLAVVTLLFLAALLKGWRERRKIVKRNLLKENDLKPWKEDPCHR